MAGVVYKDYKNPHLSTVHKFGHARLASQATVIVGLIALFVFDVDKGIFSDRYKPGNERG